MARIKATSVPNAKLFGKTGFQRNRQSKILGFVEPEAIHYQRAEDVAQSINLEECQG